MFYRYMVQHIRVPGRPNLGFTGSLAHDLFGKPLQTFPDHAPS
jgi:hypothetical protein